MGNVTRNIQMFIRGSDVVNATSPAFQALNGKYLVAFWRSGKLTNRSGMKWDKERGKEVHLSLNLLQTTSSEKDHRAASYGLV